MRVYLMTDMEGVAGVLNFQEWTSPGTLYYEMAREFLTLEVNAAVEGLLEGGALEIVVVDGHGPGGINVKLLDPRVQLQRGWSDPVWPLGLDGGYDYVVWVGQHAKACTEYGHLCHTQSLEYIDESVNGISIGEFGELAMCASELGVRAIFGSGDHAFTREAQALVPGIETVAVKWGVKPGTGEELDEERYARHVTSARHLHPVRARQLIREGARRAIERAKSDDFGLIPLTPPFKRTILLRPTKTRDHRVAATMEHPTSFIGVMNAKEEFGPV
ncbi:MAG: M55 family metallopeptidase [Armatimonadota bacterium]